MRTLYDVNGIDITATTFPYIAGTSTVTLATLYLIGDLTNPNSIKITDYDAPIYFGPYGTFVPDTVKRGTVTSKAGFEVASLDVTWSPNNFNFTSQLNTTSPYQQAINGVFDGANMFLWTVYFNAPGRILAFSELFGGRVGNLEVARTVIKITISSFLDVVNQTVPGSVIETLNSIAGFKGATPPPGLTQVPTFSVVTAGNTSLNAQCNSPSGGQIFGANVFQDGFIFFTSGALQGSFYTLTGNTSATISGTTYNHFMTYKRFPIIPSAGDTFYASATFPINQADGQYYGFPFVPDPSSAF